MKNVLVIYLVGLVWYSCEATPFGRPPAVKPPVVKPPQGASTLKLVHVIFRHGHRNPEQATIWAGNLFADEKFYPDGFGQLTNEGKLREYNLGKFLRERYDSLLGDIWDINIQDFTATDYNRTKMSGLLVMAGLWPPRGRNVWNPEFPWQPIPYNYKSPITNDSLLFPSNCPSFATAFGQILSSPEVNNYLTERYGAAIQYLSENVGSEVDYYTAGLSYFDAMKVQEHLGFPLPAWTRKVYPSPLNDLAVDLYYILTNTTHLRQILAGTFIKKIITDTQSFIDKTLQPSSRKLFVYSAHDFNVGTIILSLDAFKIPETPPYGSTVIFEVHNIRGIFGLKLFYVDYNEGSPHPLTIPGCNHFCPFDQFYSLVEEILPTTDVCYGN